MSVVAFMERRLADTARGAISVTRIEAQHVRALASPTWTTCAVQLAREKAQVASFAADYPLTIPAEWTAANGHERPKELRDRRQQVEGCRASITLPSLTRCESETSR